MNGRMNVAGRYLDAVKIQPLYSISTFEKKNGRMVALMIGDDNLQLTPVTRYCLPLTQHKQA
jgi:hypothetical protein